MLYNVIIDLLNDNFVEENVGLRILQKELVQFDKACIKLAFHQLQLIWDFYVDTKMMEYLPITQENIKEFIYWLEDPM